MAKDTKENLIARRDRPLTLHTDIESGAVSGVNGTPTFFINGQRHEAAFELEDLIEAIEAVHPAGRRT